MGSHGLQTDGKSEKTLRENRSERQNTAERKEGERDAKKKGRALLNSVLKSFRFCNVTTNKFATTLTVFKNWHKLNRLSLRLLLITITTLLWMVLWWKVQKVCRHLESVDLATKLREQV